MARNAENKWIQDSAPSRLLKMIGHWEIYKMAVSRPGDVFEIGVFKGSSLIQWATFRQALENPDSRKIVAFDMFGPFPVSPSDSPRDHEFVRQFSRDAGQPLTQSPSAAGKSRAKLGPQIE